jgi:hypothetical protein
MRIAAMPLVPAGDTENLPYQTEANDTLPTTDGDPIADGGDNAETLLREYGEPTPAEDTGNQMAPFARLPLERRHAPMVEPAADADLEEPFTRDMASEPAAEKITPLIQPEDPLADVIPSILSRSTVAADSTAPSSASGADDVAVDPRPSSRRRPGLTEAESPAIAAESEPPAATDISENEAARAPIIGGTNTPAVTAVAAVQGSLIGVRTVGSPSVIVGRAADFTVFAGNQGTADAKNVEVTIRYPQWAEIVTVKAADGATQIVPTENGGEVVWQIDNLAGGTEQSVKIELIPRRSEAFNLGVTWKAEPVIAGAQIEVLEPKLELAVQGPQDVRFGERKVYTIDIKNPGSAPAENVRISLLPLNGGDTPVATTDLGDLAPGASDSLEIEMTARTAGNSLIRVLAEADGNLSTVASQMVQVRRAQLELAARGPELKYAGGTADYSATLRNIGDATADDVTAQVSLPAGSELRGSKSENGSEGVHDADEDIVRWNLGSVPAGETRELGVQLALEAEGPKELPFSARAATDLIATDTVVTNVRAAADLKLVVNDAAGPSAVGDDVTYDIEVLNRGAKAAEDVRLVIFFSNGIEPVSAAGGEHRIAVGQVVFEPIPRIAAGQTIRLKVTARAELAGNHTCRTQLECKAADTRLAVDETTQFYEVSRTANAGLGESR